MTDVEAQKFTQTIRNSQLRSRRNNLFDWPGAHAYGATVSFDFDAEEVWIGEDPENANRPGVLSQGAYGPKVAIPLILDLLEKHDITATFFVCGRDAERHPESIKQIISRGHEIAHHGNTHTSPTDMSEQEEQAELRDALETLRSLGAEVVGYRSPSWDFSPHTLSLLSQNQFQYSSNLLDDIKPYMHEAYGLVELPVSWILDDAPHFWFANDTWEKTIRSPHEVSRVWRSEIEGIAKLGGHVMLTMHPMIIGRPSRLEMLDEVLANLTESNAWIATARQTADLMRENAKG
jgi:peptidoglycan/xylan/chitin deacetylase (PgdA/CDA1 family)